MPAPRRIHELDLLRGFFILVIVVDHLQFWPSYMRYVTGEGRLWVSAAEGFFLISGLLIGYIRAYKGRHTPLPVLTKKLFSRAVMLYIWGIGITLFITLFTFIVGKHDLLPALPPAHMLSSWTSLLWGIVSGQYFNDWIYFLRLYTFMLLATPLFLWLLRKGQTLLIVGLIVLGYIAALTVWKEPALVWQVLFFGAALVGYKLESILDYFRTHTHMKKVFVWTTLSFTVVTMMISFFFTHGWEIVETPNNPVMTRETFVAIKAQVDPVFSNSPMTIGRILLAFTWFAGLLVLLHVSKKYVLRFLGWLLMPFGERSLSVYCLQALLLPLIVVVVPVSSSSIINTAVTVLVVLGLWGLLKIPLIRKLLPV